MRNLNKVMLIGYVGKDPDLRYIAGETAVTTFSLATTEKWTRNGKRESHTEWHHITAWNRLGKVCGEFLSKGSHVYVEGSIRTTKWQEENGTNRERKEIIAQRIDLLDRKNSKSPEDNDFGDDEPAF